MKPVCVALSITLPLSLRLFRGDFHILKVFLGFSQQSLELLLQFRDAQGALGRSEVRRLVKANRNAAVVAMMPSRTGCGCRPWRCGGSAFGSHDGC
jgi:hypothetical protein